MYTYNKIFIGIPLNQFFNKITPKQSKNFIEELAELVGEDLSMKRAVEYMENITPEMSNFLINVKKLNDRDDYYKEFEDLITDYSLDFHNDYNGADDNPMIFGFYIDDLLPIPNFGVAEFSVDLEKMYLLRDRFKRLCYYLVGEDIFKKLSSDNMIGIYYNYHSS